MENASKALIIAGAILLAILIIGLGMFVYQQASGAMDGIGMDSERVTAYNAPFLQYEGTVSGTEAKALYSLIRNHNNSKGVDDVSLQIALTIGGPQLEGDTAHQAAPTAAVDLPSNTLQNGATYEVTFATDPNSGFITACDIFQKTGTD